MTAHTAVRTAAAGRFAAREQADPTIVAARIEAAAGRCECAGACGSDHPKGSGRCVNEHHARRPLTLAPSTPGGPWLPAARTPVAELRVWGPTCLTGTDRAARRAGTEAVLAAQPGLFGDAA